LGHGEHEIGRRGAGRELAVQLESDDVGDQHRHWLAEHRRFRFDAADAPAQHAQTVDHRRVRVGADERIGIGLVRRVVDEDRLAEVLEVDLMTNAGAGRHDAEVLERALTPAQEDVALLVALELALGVDHEGGLAAELVDLHRVVDHEIDRLQRVDALRVAAERLERVAHRGEIDDRWNAGEILEQHAARSKGDLLLDAALGIPLGERGDVVFLDELIVLVPQQILEEDLEAERKPTGSLFGDLVDGVETVERVRLAVDGDRRAATEAVLACHGSVSLGSADVRRRCEGDRRSHWLRLASHDARLTTNLIGPGWNGRSGRTNDKARYGFNG